MENPQIYVINMVKNTLRLDNMRRRLSEFNLNFHTIYAEPDSEGYNQWKKGATDPVENRLNCCYSHILAFRKFVESGKPWCLIMEDDALLIKDFPNRLRTLIQRKPKYCQAILLSPYHTKQFNENMKLADELYEIKESTFSNCCYYIERDFAIHILKIYDHPIETWPEYRRCDITNEYFISRTVGCGFSHPAFAIEDCLSTDNAITVMSDKKNYWDWYGFDNYQSM